MNEQELEHYGVLGMKWGVRRYQPYPEGKDGRYVGEKTGKKHKMTGTEKWKDQQKAKIDKMYDKTYRRLEKAMKESPDDESIKEYRTELEKQHAKDLKSVDDMTFKEVMENQEIEAEEIKEARIKKVAAVGNAIKWTGQMTLLAARIGGIGVTLSVLAGYGDTITNYLASEDGQKLIDNGKSILQKVGDVEILGIKVFQQKAKDVAPESTFTKTLNSYDVSHMTRATAYIPPDKMAERMSNVHTAASDLDNALSTGTFFGGLLKFGR